MSRIVMKFGGTSVADLDRIRNVATRVKREVEAGNEVAVVVSAMAGVTNQLVALVPGPVAAARRARIRHRGGDRRAGHHRPAGDRAAGDRRRGALLAGLADPDPHRQRPRQGAHRRHRGRRTDPPHADRPGRRGVRLPGHRHRQPRHHARPRRLRHLGGGAGGRAARRPLRHLHRRRRRLHHRPAHRAEGAQARAHQLRGNAGAGLGRRQGAADPQRRTGDERAGARSGAVVKDAADDCRARWWWTRTRSWKSRLYPASPTRATTRRSRCAACPIGRRSPRRCSARCRSTTSMST